MFRPAARFALLFGSLALAMGTSALAEDWPNWRGPRGDGLSGESNLPTRWSPTSGIAWKTEIPGVGYSSPVVWGDRIFVTTCDEPREMRQLLCLNAGGDILWTVDVLQAPLEGKHELNTFASGTPATDGQLVYVSFLDREEMFVAAYDFQSGDLVWSARPGPFSSKHGFCTCPVLYENLVIVNGDHDGDGFIAALDRKSGTVVWNTPRPNNTRSYVTPIIRELAGKTQMVLSGSKCVQGLDPRTGKPLWTLDGPTEQFVASMVDHDGMLFLTAGYPEYHILALRPDRAGKIGEDEIVWRTNQGAGYVPSPVALNGVLVVCTDSGVATAFDTESGEELWKKRISDHISASLVAADGNVYIVSDNGETTILRAQPKLEVVAVNPLGEESYASPAISDGVIYLRGEKHLFAISGGK